MTKDQQQEAAARRSIRPAALRSICAAAPAWIRPAASGSIRPAGSGSIRAAARRSMSPAASRSIRVAFWAVAAWLAAFASPSSQAGQADDLAQNRAVWRAAAVGDYEYGYNKYCACHPDTPPETLVTVRDGRVVRVRHRPVGYDKEVEAPRGLEYYWTIEGLFDLVARAIEKHAEIRADYDSQLGYPTEIHIDYDQNLIGDEVDLRVTRLERLSD